MIQNPFMAFRFVVEFDEIILGGFSEVSGLSRETEVETIREGGNNLFEYKLPKGTKYSDLVLKRGVIDTEIWTWYDKVVTGKIQKQNGCICLLNSSGERAMEWNIIDAYPVKWEGPQFNASSSAVATESLTLVHHGINI
ncbi:phage tail protein [Candidatus Uabimicrobium sp. HlEnr_7]|uniref:phage tail protein n=1 Tax=Candidatus Uabimicrobium helgolandensis TaxID=3095367 RepID=UPI0035569A9D